MISRSLLEILVCPNCRSGVVLDKKRNIILCNRCQLYYEIESNIPIMIVDEAKKMKKLP